MFQCEMCVLCRVEAKLAHWYVTGLQQQGEVPSLIASVGGSDSSLLSVLFELNPQDSTADQLLRVHSQPVEIIYDAVRDKCKHTIIVPLISDIGVIGYLDFGSRLQLLLSFI